MDSKKIIEFINNLGNNVISFNQKSEIHDKLLLNAHKMVGNDNKLYMNNERFVELNSRNFDALDMIENVVESNKLKASFSTKPDKEIETIIKLFEGHFYDPYTENNFNGKRENTALSNFVYYSKKAFESIDINKQCKAYLAKACHYLADLNEPHHASNNIARFKSGQIEFLRKTGLFKEAKESNHEEYEIKVREWYSNPEKLFEAIGIEAGSKYYGVGLILDHMPIEEIEISDECGLRLKIGHETEKKVNNLNEEDIYCIGKELKLDEYCEKIGKESAVFAHQYIEDVLSDNEHKQAIATLYTIHMTQIQIARFLFYFFTSAKL